MAFPTRLPKVGHGSEHCNERTWMCYHQAPPLAKVVAHVGDARRAKPHLEHNPLSLLGTCHATPMRKLNDPGNHKPQGSQAEPAGPTLQDIMFSSRWRALAFSVDVFRRGVRRQGMQPSAGAPTGMLPED